MDKKDRLLKIVLYSKYLLHIQQDKDLAKTCGIDRTNLSKALKGDKMYMDTVYNRLNAYIPNTFNSDWYYNGVGNILIK